MPKRTKQGWIAPLPDGVDYVVNKERPTGVFVECVRGTPPKLQYAGAGLAAGEWFELPYDPDFLRDIAAAINELADHLEE